MVIAGLALAGVAALVHVFIFYLESIAWTSARARAVFGCVLQAKAEGEQDAVADDRINQAEEEQEGHGVLDGVHTTLALV